VDKHDQLGPWIRRFLLEHLIEERNLSPNTQRSYRDALAMLLPFIATQLRKPLDQLQVSDVSGDCVRQFLTHLERTRNVSVDTRNQRLAAIHSLARFIAEYSPQHVAWYGQVRTVPFKKSTRKLIPYLDKPEVEALLAVPDCTTKVGRRNYALLLFLYNSGAPASEAANLCATDLDLGTASHIGASVRILGKGRKIRRCPLWQKTAAELARIVEGRPPNERVFINQRGQPLTRFGVYGVLRACVGRASISVSTLRSKVKENQPAHDPSFDGDPSAARRCRSEHDPIMVGTCLVGYDSGLPRDRSGNEGSGAGKVQYHRCQKANCSL
jgi:integrase/recombinase XerD